MVPLPDDIHGLESREAMEPTSSNDEVWIGFPERDQDLLKEVRNVSRQEVVLRSNACRESGNVRRLEPISTPCSSLPSGLVKVQPR